MTDARNDRWSGMTGREPGMMMKRNYMAGKFGYRLNPDTLLYEIEKVSVKSRFLRAFLFLVWSVILAAIVWWFYISVLGLELPKTIILRKQNADWASRLEQMNKRLDAAEQTLLGVAGRDDGIYRNIFGMNPVDPQERYSGFSGVNRYAYLDEEGASPLLKNTVKRIDYLTKEAYVQSLSFDDVGAVSKRAGDMASCIPVIIPLNPGSRYRLSSPFGYRTDPVYGRTAFHAGLDFATDIGNKVYCSGDGVVEKATNEIRGYGNCVIVNHGFGYRTRYAHLKTILVGEGQKVYRGSLIGEAGRSGKATGPHLHYEVIYRGNAINPINYVDLDMDATEYETMVKKAEEASGMIPPSKLPKRTN